MKDYSKFPNRGDYLFVEHDSHMHVIFCTAPNNLQRKLNSIMSLFGVLPSSIIECKNSLQVVRNISRLVSYMASRGRIKIIGDKFVPHLGDIEPCEWNDCTSIPSDCRRKRIKEEQNLVISDKRNRYLALADEVFKRNITHISQIHDKFSLAEIMTIIAKNGNIYKDVIKQAINNNNRKQVEYQRNTPYIKLYFEKLINFHCECENDNNVNKHEKELQSLIWLEKLFSENGIYAEDFVKKLNSIFDRKYDKINALVIEGPTNTGKSLICKLATFPYIYGTASRRGDQTNFHLENLLFKSIAVMEEPRITGITADDFKQLLGGEPFQVDVKYQEKDWLQRTPTIITTNEDIGLRLSKLDRDAMYSRIFHFNFCKQISSNAVDGSIPAPLYKICPFAWFNFINKYLATFEPSTSNSCL